MYIFCVLNGSTQRYPLEFSPLSRVRKPTKYRSTKAQTTRNIYIHVANTIDVSGDRIHDSKRNSQCRDCFANVLSKRIIKYLTMYVYISMQVQRRPLQLPCVPRTLVWLRWRRAAGHLPSRTCG